MSSLQMVIEMGRVFIMYVTACCMCSHYIRRDSYILFFLVKLL